MSVRLKAASLLTVAVLVLAGCSSDSGKSDGGQSESIAGPQLDLVTPGVLTVGADLELPPFDYVEGNETKGFDVELLQAVAERLGLKIEWVKNDWSTIFTSLAAGKFDVVASAPTITEEREQIVDFTRPYFQTSLGLIVAPDVVPGIGSFDDLQKGDVIGVQKAGPELAWSQENLEPRGVEIKAYEDFPAAALDLTTGRVNAVVGDSAISVAQVENLPGLQLADTVDTGGVYAFAIRQGNDSLKTAISRAIEELYADGSFEQIWNKYFDFEVPAQLPQSPAFQE